MAHHKNTGETTFLAVDDQALNGIDRCVMCGLCLPHCPTYQLSLNESESPRGRLNSMRVLLEEHTTPDPIQLQHLDNCLNCLACENMCPSRVPYSELIDHARGRLVAKNQLKRSIIVRLISRLSTSARHTRWLTSWSQIPGYSVIQRLLTRIHLKALPGLTAAIRILPATPDAFNHRPPSPPTSSKKKNVSLLTGCADSAWSGSTLDSAITLLTACGYNVVVPENQSCCGALDLHEGQLQKAHNCHQQNQSAFGQHTVVSVSTACSSHLQTHTDLSAFDIIDFLLREPAFSELHFSPLNHAVSVHTPCSQKNDLKSPDSTQRILQHIPDIEMQALNDNYGCCGAAGTHFLRNPEVAESLRTPILKQALTHNTPLMVSANIGCRLHLSAGFRELESETEVIHPVTLLARQLRPPKPNNGNHP